MRYRFGWVSIVPMSLFLILPLGALLFGVNPTDIWSLVRESGAQQAIWVSVRSCTITLVVLLVFGTPLAWFIAMGTSGVVPFFRLLVDIPAALPPAVSGLALLLAFGPTGWIGSWLFHHGINLPLSFSAVVCAQLLVSSPFYIRPLADGFRLIEQDFIEAANLEGASRKAIIVNLVMPLIAPVLIGAASLAVSRALGEFGATILFAGSFPGITETIPIHIYQIFGENLNQAIGLGAMMLVIAAISSIVARSFGQWFMRRIQS